MRRPISFSIHPWRGRAQTGQTLTPQKSNSMRRFNSAPALQSLRPRFLHSFSEIRGYFSRVLMRPGRAFGQSRRTLEQDAMDVSASPGELTRTVKAYGPDPDAGIKSCEAYCRATTANKPGRTGESELTHRGRQCRIVSAYPVTPRILFSFARLRMRGVHLAFPARFIFLGGTIGKIRTNPAVGMRLHGSRFVIRVSRHGDRESTGESMRRRH